ncbi:hypothetical protein ACFW0H_27725 [Pseudomonas sp. CR3202]|uniref:hypothetical protein n=1 Tax=Pseudomonas sp. CR3202 TaxID=3351532 RepID=UPI003BF3F397
MNDFHGFSSNMNKCNPGGQETEHPACSMAGHALAVLSSNCPVAEVGNARTLGIQAKFHLLETIVIDVLPYSLQYNSVRATSKHKQTCDSSYFMSRLLDTWNQSSGPLGQFVVGASFLRDERLGAQARWAQSRINITS